MENTWKRDGWLGAPEACHRTRPLPPPPQKRMRRGARSLATKQAPEVGTSRSEKLLVQVSNARKRPLVTTDSVSSDVSQFLQTASRRQVAGGENIHAPGLTDKLRELAAGAVSEDLPGPEAAAQRAQTSRLYQRHVVEAQDSWDTLSQSVSCRGVLQGGFRTQTEGAMGPPTAEQVEVVNDMVASGTLLPLPAEIVRLNNAALERDPTRFAPGPAVSKAWESSYLREPKPTERPCVASMCQNGLCQGQLHPVRNPYFNINGGQGVPLAEFLTPEQEHKVRRDGKPLEVHGFCLLCLRFMATEVFTRTGQTYLGGFKGLMAPHSVRTDEPGEYASEACIYSHDPSSGCERMFVMFADNHVVWKTDPKSGSFFLEQTEAVAYRPKNGPVAAVPPPTSSTWVQ